MLLKDKDVNIYLCSCPGELNRTTYKNIPIFLIIALFYNHEYFTSKIGSVRFVQQDNSSNNRSFFVLFPFLQEFILLR